jgi:hypothetical protein
VAKIAEMDNASKMDELENIGKAVAAEQIKAQTTSPRHSISRVRPQPRHKSQGRSRRPSGGSI